LESDVAEAESDLAKTEAERLREEATLVERRSELAALEGDLEKLAAEQEVKLTEIAAAEARFRKIQEKTGGVRAAEAGQAERLAELDTQIVAANTALADLEGRKDTLSVEFRTLETELQDRKEQLAVAEQALTSADQARVDAEVRLAEIREELESGRAALEKTLQGNDNVVKEANALESKLSNLAAEVQNVEKQRDAASVELQSLQLDVEKARVDLAGLVEERSSLDADFESVNNETVVSNVDPLLSILPVWTESGVRIAHVLFNHSSAELSPGAERKVREAAAWINGNEPQKVRLIGYADATGSREANVRLSEARAKQAAALLGRLGVQRDIIEIEAVGEDVLIEATGNRVAEPLNRSVGIFIGE
jgi:outer membrane protein OmpA-like peptidoglycan-associated protein